MAEWSSDAHLTRGRWAGGAGRERTAHHCGTVAEQTSCHHWAGKFKRTKCDFIKICLCGSGSCISSFCQMLVKLVSKCSVGVRYVG